MASGTGNVGDAGGDGMSREDMEASYRTGFVPPRLTLSDVAPADPDEPTERAAPAEPAEAPHPALDGQSRETTDASRYHETETIVPDRGSLTFQGRIVRTAMVKPAIALTVRELVYALLRNGDHVEVVPCVHPIPGYPDAPSYQWKATLKQWTVHARTREGAWCAMLTFLMDNNVFPLT